MDHRPADRVALLDRHPERVAGQRRGRVVADRPADDAAAERVEHDRAVDLALAGRVLGDVGQPQLVGPVAAELAVDEILGGRRARRLATSGRRCGRRSRPAASASRPRCARPRSRGRASARRRRAWRRRCRTRRRAPRGSRRSATRAGPLAPTAAGPARRRSPTHETSSTRQATSTGSPSLGDHRDRLEAPFGRTDSFSSSAARRCTASSVSSARIRSRAARSSSRSSELNPGSSPRSICSCRRQRVDRLVADLEQPRHLARPSSPPRPDRALADGTPPDTPSVP